MIVLVVIVVVDPGNVIAFVVGVVGWMTVETTVGIGSACFGSGDVKGEGGEEEG